jgi:HEAT repeat protein
VVLSRREVRRSLAVALAVGAMSGGAGQGLAQPAALSNAGPAMKEYGRQLQDQSLPEAHRLELIRMFATWAADDAREPLVSVLGDPSPAIRAAAAEGLGWPRNTGATQALVARLDALDEASHVKAAALRALGRIGDQSARQRVVAATQDPDPAVRAAALWAVSLGELRQDDDRTGFLLRLATERAADLQTRAQSVSALGHGTRTPEVVAVLAGLLEHEPPIPMPLLGPRATQQERMGARYRQARDVRAWAADALGRLDARETLPILLRAAQDPDDFFLRQLALRVLATWNEEAGRPVLVKALADPFPDNRLIAVHGLARARDPQFVPALLGRLSDADIQVRIGAVAAIAHIGDAGAVGALEKVRESETNPYMVEALDVAVTRLKQAH